MKMFMCKFAQDEVTHLRVWDGSKKSVQQGRNYFYARNVWLIREHGNMARTPLAAFFNRPQISGPFSPAPSPDTSQKHVKIREPLGLDTVQGGRSSAILGLILKP